MSREALEHLEAELQERLEEPTLAIYADQLQTLGDPRGELIVLDLRGAGPDADARRAELVGAWLGEDVPLAYDARRGAWRVAGHEDTLATFDRGFLEIVHGAGAPVHAVVQLLASPAGRYLRQLMVSATPEQAVDVLEAVAHAPRPWLYSLALHVEPAPAEWLVDDELHARLCGATPRLELLDLDARHVFRVLAHPAIREIAMVGPYAIGLPDGPAMPRLRVLDLAFDFRDPPIRGSLGRLVAPGRFPQLRQLRLHRCEPGARFVFPRLLELGVARGLTHLRLPSVRNRADRELVQDAIDQLPSLRVLEIERAYTGFSGCPDELRHPTAQIKVPPERCWYPPDRIAPDRMLEIHRIVMPVRVLVELMEEQYEVMAVPSRDAWDRFWTAIMYELGWIQGREIGVLARVLAAAIAGLEHDDADLEVVHRHVIALGRDPQAEVIVRWA